MFPLLFEIAEQNYKEVLKPAIVLCIFFTLCPMSGPYKAIPTRKNVPTDWEITKKYVANKIN